MPLFFHSSGWCKDHLFFFFQIELNNVIDIVFLSGLIFDTVALSPPLVSVVSCSS
jgi:hypothetical protein